MYFVSMLQSWTCEDQFKLHALVKNICRLFENHLVENNLLPVMLIVI
jgi:hypothetical protein